MTILIVHPFRNIGSPDYSFMSIGMISTANTLIKMGHHVIGVNLPMECSLRINGNSDIKTYLKTYSPDMVIISFHWYEFLLGCLQIAKEVHEFNPHTLCVVAGMSATFLREYLRDTELFHYVLLDGTSIVELMDEIGASKNLGIPCFDEENLINIAFLNNHQYYYKTDINGFSKKNKKNFWVNLARGCTFNCEYCGGSNYAHKAFYNRKKFETRSLERVIKDLAFLLDQEVENISFTHDLEMLRYSRELIDVLSLFPFDYYYESFSIPKAETLVAINRALLVNNQTCKIAITAISGNEDVRHREGKNFSNEQLVNIVKQCGDLGVECDIYFTLNCIGEDTYQFNKTVDFANELLLCGKHVDIICQPYYQEEIGSIRWIKQQKNIAEAAESLIEYLLLPSKNMYFIQQDHSLIEKVMLWNNMVQNHTELHK